MVFLESREKKRAPGPRSDCDSYTGAAAEFMAKDTGWWQFLYGLWMVVLNVFFQKIRCAHLPKRLPLQLSSPLTAIVTGATSGIGVEISGELARAGVHVVLAVRNTSAGEDLIEKWRRSQELKDKPPINAEVMELNLLSLASVRAFAKKWNDRQIPLHILINNAGIFAFGVRQKFSEDGYEHHMQVNHLSHALLSMLLLPSLLRGAPSRIINVNSDMHHLGFVVPEDMNLTKRRFSSTAGYCGSKLAQIMFSSILQSKLPSDAGVEILLVHPGEVMTGVTRDLPAAVRKAEQISKVVRFSPAEASICKFSPSKTETNQLVLGEFVERRVFSWFRRILSLQPAKARRFHGQCERGFYSCQT